MTDRLGRFSLRSLVLATAVGLSLSCGDLFGPSGLATPRLQALLLGGSLRDGGILSVNAYPADTAFRLDRDRRVRVEVSVSSGDIESVGLYREFCPPRERRPQFNCFMFLLAMRTGYAAAEVADEVAAIGGRISSVSPSGTIIGVTLFDPSNLVAHARRARSWTGVAFTDLGWSGGAPDLPSPPPFRSWLMLPVPVDTGVAVAGDGIVQLRSGDTVSVRYRQPEGGMLGSQVSVP